MHTEPGPVEGPCKHREITPHGEWRCIRNALFTPDGAFIGHRGEPFDMVQNRNTGRVEFRPSHYMVCTRNPDATRIIGGA